MKQSAPKAAALFVLASVRMEALIQACGGSSDAHAQAAVPADPLEGFRQCTVALQDCTNGAALGGFWGLPGRTVARDAAQRGIKSLKQLVQGGALALADSHYRLRDASHLGNACLAAVPDAMRGIPVTLRLYKSRYMHRERV